VKSCAEYYGAVFTYLGKIQRWLKIKICKLLKLVIVTIQSEVMKCYFDSPKAITGDFQLYIACANLDHFESSEIVGFVPESNLLDRIEIFV
jgi:hypothetical protein